MILGTSILRATTHPNLKPRSMRRVVIVCITRDSARKDSFMRREIAYALQCGKPIAVARLVPVPPPISVATHTFFELYKNWDQEVRSLARFCRRRSSSNTSVENPTIRFQYLQRVYRDVVRYLDRAVLRPLGVRDSRFLEVKGSFAASGSETTTDSDVLSPRFYRSLDPQVSILKCPREAFAESRGRLAIIGSAGCGKTVALMALGRDLASEALLEEEEPIPLLVSAATWKGDVACDLQGWLAAEVPFLADEIVNLIEANRTAILVDGLDEVPALVVDQAGGRKYTPRADLIAALPTTAPLVVTLRAREYEEFAAQLGIRSVLELLPLTNAEVEAYAASVPVAASLLKKEKELRIAAESSHS